MVVALLPFFLHVKRNGKIADVGMQVRADGSRIVVAAWQGHHWQTPCVGNVSFPVLLKDTKHRTLVQKDGFLAVRDNSTDLILFNHDGTPVSTPVSTSMGSIGLKYPHQVLWLV